MHIDDMSIHKDVEATLSVKENWGMGSMGGHPMMNNGGDQVGPNVRMTISYVIFWMRSI